MILPEQSQPAAPGGVSLNGYFLCIAPILQKWSNSFGMCGGDDGTRTRGLCSDRAAF